ncbi:MATE family efflux transporter [Endozoicomonas euniceicola]|uniref:Multidrug-efflux transporter n=1 Tax=Endozoicomonas euniceicola TaxID=1234143 RepID=A0ABY6GUT8_9GAMM|nr:MATE family efflux transporter [Endozoicomonas euniceicola]UYM15709.1 MATE family efflux transporter [Endozoicomonas euniceicola]
MKQRSLTIVKLATPIILAMLSQSLLNLVDAALVGPLGEEALAAVGAGSYANFVALALVAGLSAGVQAQVARRYGAGQKACCAVPVNHGIIIALLFALPASLLLMIMAPWILQLFSTGGVVHDAAETYFRIRVMALMAAAMSLSFRGYWNGTGQPFGFLRILVISHLFNVVVSYILIYGKLGLPAMGVAGAAMGTFLAMHLSALLNLLVLFRQVSHHGFLQPFRRSDWLNLKTLIKLAIPDSLQQTLFALGIMLFFAIIAQLGTQEMAIAHVLMNISLFMILPGIGLGMASNTLVSQELGAQRPEMAITWGWNAVWIATALLSILSLPLLVIPEWVLGLFLHKPELVSAARLPLQLTGVGIILDSASLVLTQTLLGAGANKTVLGIRFGTQWGFLLPVSWLLGTVVGTGLTTLWLLTILQRLISSTAFIMIWKRRQWSHIRI